MPALDEIPASLAAAFQRVAGRGLLELVTSRAFAALLSELVVGVTEPVEGAVVEDLGRFWRRSARPGADLDAEAEAFRVRAEARFGATQRTLAEGLTQLVRAQAAQWQGRLTVEWPTTWRLVNPEAERIARTSAARVVAGVSEQARERIREAVVTSTNTGEHPRQLAARIRSEVPLLPGQVAAVRRMAAAQLDAGAKPAQVSRLVAAQSARFAAQRALTIARTELLQVANAAQDATWRARTADGTLPPTITRAWIVAQDDRTCEVCRPMGGRTAALGGVFDLPGGATVDHPPAHPRCRCTVGVADMLTDAEMRSLRYLG